MNMEKENIRKEIEAIDEFVLTTEKEIKQQDISLIKKQFANQLDDLSDAFVNRTNDNNDLFLNDNADFSTFKDSVFELRTLAKKAIDAGHSNVINATIGSLFDENKKIVTLNTVYDCLR